MKTTKHRRGYVFLCFKKNGNYLFNLRIFFLIFALFFISGLHAQNFLWAKSAQGNDTDFPYHCTTDPQGNVIVTGFFYSPTITFGTVTLTNYEPGSADFFIVKYNSSGQVLWAKKAGGSCNEVGISCATDGLGNIYVTGVFTSSSVTFGTIQLNNSTTVVNSCSPGDIFLVKYSPNGNILWAKKAGGSSSDVAYGCTTDANRNVIVTGYFDSPSINFGTNNLSNSGGTDIFLVKYDSNGNFIWAKKAGGADDDISISCCTDAQSNIIVTGFYGSPSINFGTTNLPCSGETDVFIAKYAPNGNLLWAKKAGGDDFELGMSCTSDAYGNVIVVGSFYSSSIHFGTTQLTNTGETDIFIAKYTTNGNLLWAKKIGGLDDDQCYSCSVDINGNIIITGIFDSPQLNFGTTSLHSAGNEDIFIAKYSSGGNLLWAISAGGPDEDGGMSCTTYGTHIILTGYFYSPSIQFGTHTLTNSGDYDFFILKMDGLVGIEEMSLNNNFQVFPNPSSGIFEIQLGENIITSSCHLEVINTPGEKIIQRSVHEDEKKITLNLSDLPKGCYLLQLSNEQGKFTRKLIVE
jgi:hypothetical protein